MKTIKNNKIPKNREIDKETKLSDAHDLVCDWCLGVLKSGQAGVNDIKAVMSFLKDNHITATSTTKGRISNVISAAQDTTGETFDTSGYNRVIHMDNYGNRNVRRTNSNMEPVDRNRDYTVLIKELVGNDE